MTWFLWRSTSGGPGVLDMSANSATSSQRDLLAATGHQQRQTPNRRRVQLWQARLDASDALAQRPQPLARRAPRVAELLVVALGVAGAEAEEQPSAAEMVDRARHVRQQVRIAIGDGGNDRADLRPLCIAGHRRQ